MQRSFDILIAPAIIYISFAFMKVTGLEPDLDLAGVHALMGAAFLLFGFSIAYLMTILRTFPGYSSHQRIQSQFWRATSLLFFLVFCDATLGLHEAFGYYLGVREAIFFLFEGALLVLIIIYYRTSFNKIFFFFIGLFILFSGLAVLGDSSAAREGIISIGGVKYSYEQAFESFSVLLLAAAFTNEALVDLSER